MFLGHFGVGFGAKAAAPRTSLGTLLLASQAIDLLWPTLLLVGVEVAPGPAADLLDRHGPATYGSMNRRSTSTSATVYFASQTRRVRGRCPVIEALSAHRNRVVTVVFLTIAAALAAVAGLVGISDNPPGIALAYGAAAVLVLAVVHPWRTSRKFRYLLYGSFFGFFVFAIVHNVFEVVAERMGGPGFLYAVLQGIQVAAFLIAVLVCPPAIVIGLVGAIVMWIRSRRFQEAS